MTHGVRSYGREFHIFSAISEKAHPWASIPLTWDRDATWGEPLQITKENKLEYIGEGGLLDSLDPSHEGP